PIVPEFDYLIIDESSKTTFQEFLVPALYAKKWILAGDVMQLSPFTDREEIVSNISQLQIENKPLKFELQQAVFYLQKLKTCLHGRYNKFVLSVSLDIFNFMVLELSHGRYSDFQGKTIFAVTNEGKNVDSEILYKRNINTVNKLELSAADIILIDESILKQYIHLIPESHVVLRGSKWLESEHAFSHNAYQQRHKFKYKERNHEFDNSIEIAEEINKYFGEKNWAEEIAWRVDREHQLRLSAKNKIKDSYSKTIDDLLPKSIKKEAVEEQINQIASMAFPSILESLVHGIKGRKVKVESTISEGFNTYDLDSRRTTLVYQHRMHPEISLFPRTQFYKENKALKDLETPQPIETMRDWDYDYYGKRSVWIDVAGNTVRNYNDKEVDVLIFHLQRFIEFAKNNPQPENNKEWTVACLTFYRGQETKIREKLQSLTHNENAYSSFTVSEGKYKINIKLHTVDKFQGHEADIVFLSMVQTKRDGFMDNPNRLNVAVTRAKFQLVIIGNYNYFKNSSQSEDLRALAENTFKQR
ncbi:MAG: ATP-binding domain-containing protein, partial [Prevotellaceae bacterium]|nr:ATP-binding domain-containing protein [Prevotellaceae bacterium]